MIEKDYLKTLSTRKKQSHVFKDFQHTGLVISQILGDDAHKTLYIKMAKFVSKETLMSLAKDIAERHEVANRGAYFMKLAKQKGLLSQLKSKKTWLKKTLPKSGQSKARVRHLF
jgi:hypothetical protein